jgi:hypothetical protein
MQYQDRLLNQLILHPLLFQANAVAATEVSALLFRHPFLASPFRAGYPPALLSRSGIQCTIQGRKLRNSVVSNLTHRTRYEESHTDGRLCLRHVNLRIPRCDSGTCNSRGLEQCDNRINAGAST